MAVTVVEDWGRESLTATREQGAIVNLTRCYLVYNLDASPVSARAAQALNASGVPQYGDSFPSNTGVIVFSQHCEMLQGEGDNSPNMARVTVEYRTVGQEDGYYIFHGDGSLSEEETNTDAGGNAISVSYTDSNGTVNVQGKTVPYMDPQSTLNCTGIEATAAPLSIVNSWNGYCNSDAWNGFPAGCWMCTRVAFTPHDMDASPTEYKLTFEFQLKRRGWTPTTYYIDPATGEPPSDLVYNVGYKRITVQGYRPFGDKFPSIA